MRPWKKWLKPISYRVAALAKVAMCPPTLVFLFAFSTIAIAFQRMTLLIFRSMARSPGNGGLVLNRDGVHVGGGDPAEHLGAGPVGGGDERFEQELGPLRPAVLEDRLHRVEPLGGLLRVGVVRKSAATVCQHVGCDEHRRRPRGASGDGEWLSSVCKGRIGGGFRLVYTSVPRPAAPGRTMRILAITTLIVGTVAALPAADPPHPLPPTAVSWDKPDGVLGEVAAALPKTPGVTVTVAPGVLKTKCAVRFKEVPFWDALQRAADATGTRVALHDGGRRAELVPREKSREVAATSGAFRVVAQQVVGRALLDQGVTVHEVHLLAHWEPRLRVYRIDTAPKVSKVTDVPGSKITADGGSAQILPLDATSEMKVKLTGLTRDSDRITALAGVFTVTAAEKLLTFAFAAPGGKLPAEQKEAGVAASLVRVQKKDDTWEIAVDVTYPPNQPVFESFQGEWWLRDNKLTLRDPKGKTFVIDDYEIPQPDSPRRCGSCTGSRKTRRRG